MNNTGLIVVILFFVCTLFSCQDEVLPDENTVDGYIEIGNLLVSDSPSQLVARMTYKNEIVPIVETETSSLLKSTQDDFPEIDLTKNYAFKLKAEVDPPVYEGNNLQATHVIIKDDYAFVNIIQGARCGREALKYLVYPIWETR